MKTYLTLIYFLLLSGFTCFSQTFIDTLQQHIYKFGLVSVIKEDLSELKNKNQYVSEYETNYDFGAKTLICEFTYDKYWYALTGHFINDTIWSVELSKKITNGDTSNLFAKFQFLDTILANKFLAQHNSLYSTNKILADFFSQRFEMFAYSCGFAGQTPESMIECLTLIKEKNKDELVSLATSVNPTDRAYGIFGLYILKQKGIKLTEGELKIIKLNQASKANTKSCNGCMLGSEALNELLTNKNLKWYYDWYKRTGSQY